MPRPLRRRPCRRMPKPHPDDADDDHAVVDADADTDADKWSLWRKPLRGNLRRLFLLSDMGPSVDWGQT